MKHAEVYVQRVVVSHIGNCRNRRSEWGGLPAHLVHLIMHNLEAMCSAKEMMILPLVCKAWLAAFTDYPGGAACSLPDDSLNIAKFCRLMPSMSSIRIEYSDYTIPPLSLSACSHLTRLQARDTLCVSDSSELAAYVDVGSLPEALKELDTQGFKADLSSLLKLRCTGLSKLALNSVVQSHTDVDILLQHLPELEVRTFTTLNLKQECLTTLHSLLEVEEQQDSKVQISRMQRPC